MPLPTPSRQAQRFLASSREKIFHDLYFETEKCGTLDIIAKGQGERFTPDTMEYALVAGYKPCPHCMPEFAQEEVIDDLADEEGDEDGGDEGEK